MLSRSLSKSSPSLSPLDNPLLPLAAKPEEPAVWPGPGTNPAPADEEAVAAAGGRVQEAWRHHRLCRLQQDPHRYQETQGTFTFILSVIVCRVEPQLQLVRHEGVGTFLCKQCCGSVPFWYGSGSADPCLWLMDPDPGILLFSSLTFKTPSKN